MLKKILIAFSFLGLISLALFSPIMASAQNNAQAPIIDPIINPNASAYENGSYTLNDILGIAIGASRWILGIVGSLALLMFIYGGFTFLISAGSSEKVSEARKIIVAAVIGLIIVFASYIIIQFVLGSLGLNWQGKPEKMTPTAFNPSIIQRT